MKAVEQMFATVAPTTPEGMAALFEYLVEDVLEGGKGCATVPEIV